MEITADGNVHRLSQAAARGSDINPLSDRDLEQKLRTSAASWNPRHDVAPLIDAVEVLSLSIPPDCAAVLPAKVELFNVSVAWLRLPIPPPV